MVWVGVAVVVWVGVVVAVWVVVGGAVVVGVVVGGAVVVWVHAVALEGAIVFAIGVAVGVAVGVGVMNARVMRAGHAQGLEEGRGPTLDEERIADAIRAVYDADGGMVPAIEDMPRLVAVARQALAPETIDCPDLDALDAALAAATPGPWGYWSRASGVIYVADERGGPSYDIAVLYGGDDDTGDIPNARLIVAAVNALPGLIAEVRRLRAHQVDGKGGGR